ncbi:MAG: hypothetical protein FWC34_11130 [Bacteroidetes bacterium]|nr:hypothetical protein [Bacteroidota bacterium]MCL2302905.1 hypothetical protein [Lentimicrobiaceae bacterium]
MANENEIAKNIRKLIEAVDFDSMLCKVVSVDDDVTCTVKTVKTGLELKNIKLNANIKDDKGFYVYPKKDSYVLVTMLDKVQGFISMCSDIEKVKIKIDGTVDVEIGGDSKIDCKGNIVFNGGKNDGLVVAEKAASKISSLENEINQLKQILTAWVPAPMDGGGALKGAISAWAGAMIQPTTIKNDLWNDKIKH